MKCTNVLSRMHVFFKKVVFYSREFRFHRSYSQCGEDLLLQSFLGDKWSWHYKGFWVDIGAFHPSIYSNTKAFSLNGWRGINVDASSDAIAEFNKHRKRDINVNVGIGLEQGVLDYYRMSSSPMNTFSKEFAEKVARDGVKLVLSILQSNDWTRYCPDYILIEIHTGGKNWEIPNCPITKYLNEQGYEFVGQGCVTTLYKRVRW